jgi:hypothetical protein
MLQLASAVPCNRITEMNFLQEERENSSEDEEENNV